MIYPSILSCFFLRCFVVRMEILRPLSKCLTVMSKKFVEESKTVDNNNNNNKHLLVKESY